MIPGGIWGISVVLALVPGWVYIRLRERHAPPNRSTGLGELLDIAGVGVVTTGSAAALAFFVPHRWLPFLIDWNSWVREGAVYQREQFREVIVTYLSIFLVAIVIAVLLNLILQRGQPPEFTASGVWINALGKRPQGYVPYISLELDDGRIYEGLLHSYTLEQQEVRDVALQAPIRLGMPGVGPVNLAIERLIISGRIVRTIGVIHIRGTKSILAKAKS